MTSQPIRLSTNFMTLIPSLTFTDYEWFPWSICNGCGMPAGNAYPSGNLVPSPISGLANAQIVETKFLELAMSLLDFSPRISLGTFSILLSKVNQLHKNYTFNSCMNKNQHCWREHFKDICILWTLPPFQFSLVFAYSSIKCRTIRILGNIFALLILLDLEIFNW